MNDACEKAFQKFCKKHCCTNSSPLAYTFLEGFAAGVAAIEAKLATAEKRITAMKLATYPLFRDYTPGSDDLAEFKALWRDAVAGE